MPITIDIDEEGRIRRSGQRGRGRYQRGTEPKAKPPKPRRSWWDRAINDAKYELNQLRTNPARSVQRALQNVNRPPSPVRAPAWVPKPLRPAVEGISGHLMRTATSPALTPLAPAGKAIVLGTGGAVNNIGRNAIELFQKATGAETVDASLTPLGRLIDRTEDAAFETFGWTPPSRMTPAEQSVRELGNSVALNTGLVVTGGKLLAGPLQGIGGARLATALNPTRATTWLGGAARIVAAESLAEIPATFLDDNRGGSAASFVNLIPGVDLPEPVTPGMDRVEAARAAFGPNALFAVTVPLGLSGGSKLLRNLPSLRRARQSARLADERTTARRALREAGIEEVNPETGAVRPGPAVQQQPQSVAEAEAQLKARLGIEDEPGPPGARPTTSTRQPTEPAPPAAADDPTLQGFAQPDTRTQGQPFAEPADPKADPWEQAFDPTLPTADSVKMLTREADDAELMAALKADEPLAALDEAITNRPPVEIDPQLTTSMLGVQNDALASPVSPWAAQWARLDGNQLRSMAAYRNSPELHDQIVNMTGRDWEQFTRQDILDGLQALQDRGVTLIPNRATGNQLVVAVGDIDIEPQRFQFKEGVNAQGVQRGGSLDNVTRWNTDMEGTPQVWLDPADGRWKMVNGHHRHQKALELGVPSLRVEELLADTPEQARAMGALSNIAQGGGTVFDAAKFMRQQGITDAAQLQELGVPMSSGHGRQGLALAKLPDNLFQAAINGELSVSKAVALGESGLDETALQEAWKALRGTQMSDATFQEVLAQASSAPVVKGSQPDLLGNTELLSLMRQKADVALAVEKLIRADKTLFGKAADGAEQLQGVGNVIDAATNAQVSERAKFLLDVFRREKYAAETPISAMLNEAAIAVNEGSQVAPLARRIKQELMVASEGLAPPKAAQETAGLADRPLSELSAAERVVRMDDLAQADMARQISDEELYEAIPDLRRWDEAEGRITAELGEGAKSEDVTRRVIEETGLSEYPGPRFATAGTLKTLRKTAKDLGIRGATTKKKADLIAAIQGAMDELRQRRAAAEATESVLTPELREAAENELIVREFRGGKIRPSDGPIPETPRDAGTDLNRLAGDIEDGAPNPQDLQQLAADEQQLSEAFERADRALEQEQVRELRDAIGYDELTFEEQKALGGAEGFEVRTADLQQVEPSAVTDMAAQLARLTGARPDDLRNALMRRGAPNLADLVDEATLQRIEPDLGAVLRGEMAPLSPDMQRAGQALLDYLGVGRMPELPAELTTPIGRQLPNGEWAFSARDRNLVMDRFKVDPETMANRLDALVDYVQESSTSGKKWVVRKNTDAWELIQNAGSEAQAQAIATRINQKNRDQAIELVRQARQAELENAGLTGTLRVPRLEAEQTFTLPMELSRMDPRYGPATIRFESDLDRAAYILAADKRTGASKAAPKVREALEAAGFDPDEIARYGAEVKQRVKDTAKAKFGTAQASRARGQLHIATGRRPGGDVQMSEFEFRSDSGWNPRRPSVEEIDARGGFYEVAYDGPTPPIAEQRARVELRQTLIEEVSRIAGPEVEIETFGGRVFTRRSAAWGGSGREVAAPGGWYDVTNDLIRVNELLTGNPERLMQIAAHEAFHRIQLNLLTAKDLDVMDNWPGALRTYLGGKKAFRDMALSEIQAVAFERYAAARRAGVDPHQAIFREFGLPGLRNELGRNAAGRALVDAVDALMPIFGRLYDFFERTINLAQGRGFRSVGAIFEDAYSGRLAQRTALSQADLMAAGKRMEVWRTSMFSLEADRLTLEREAVQLRKTALEFGC